MADENGQRDEEKKSNLFAKLFIILIFLLAITFAVLAVAMQMQNQKREAQLIEPGWKLSKPESVLISDAKDIDKLAEMVGVAGKLAKIVNRWQLKKMKGNIRDDRKDMKEMELRIADILTTLGIRTGYAMNRDFEHTYQPPKNVSKAVRKAALHFLQEGVTVKINAITREKLIKFIMLVEDNYPFATAYVLEMSRDKGDDKGDRDEWKAVVKFIWFKTKPSKTRVK